MENFIFNFNKERPFTDFTVNSEKLREEVQNGEKNELFLINNDIIIPTRYTLYLAISQASKWFADMIIKLDTKRDYHFRNIKLVKDKEAIKKELKKYSKERKLVEDLLNKWKDDNQDLYDIKFSIANVRKYVENFVFDTSKITSVEDAVNGYKYSKMLLKKEDWTSIATQPRRTIKEEYKELYKKEKDRIHAIVGYPGDSEIEKKVPKIEVESTRLALNRKPYESTVSSSIFVEEFCKYLINNNFNDSLDDETEDN